MIQARALLLVTSVLLTSACALDRPMEQGEGEIFAAESALCENPEATNSVMAALAAATARELRRWAPEIDFRINKGGPSWRLELTPTGASRCTNGRCRNVEGLLSLQKDSAAGTTIAGAALNPGVLRDRLVSSMDRQLVCNNRVDNHAGDDCPRESHELAFSGVTAGQCGEDYWFRASQPNSKAPLAHPAQLKNQLLWAGHPENPYLAFDAQGDDVKIDPTAGLIEGDATRIPSCRVGCTIYSAKSVVGQCCMCDGHYRTFVRAIFSPDYYQCK